MNANNKNPRKRKRNAKVPAHRWTNEETISLLKYVLRIVKDDFQKFEKPTSAKFYENFYLVANSVLAWTILKGKMRHLKKSFFKIEAWKREIGAGLLKHGNDKIVRDYILKICPYWNLLYQIFGERQAMIPDIIDSNFFCSDVVPEQIGIDDPTNVDTYEITEIESSDSSSSCYETFENNVETPQIPAEMNRTASPPLIFISDVHDKPKNEIDDKKLEKHFEIELERIKFEKKKIEFEKDKLKSDLEIRMYEIDKQFELKKLQLEQEERLKRYEIELKISKVIGP